ncbi:MAG: hypothetical protein HYX68_17315 [Planctomycetes bacterium]|jgi:REP element-mobilizing transposase RayT|nr:hypothetical protein [Planctomycetota bacterium]
MEFDENFALLITWTCYGTWLPGDPRGHVSNILLPEGGFLDKENTPRTPYRSGDVSMQQNARRLLKHAPVYLDVNQVLVVAQTLVEAARAREWSIPRAAIMANHVHVVVMDCPDDGSKVRRVLKGTTQAALTRHRGKPQRWWTQGGSDRYKHGQAAIDAAIKYVADQERKLAEVVDMKPAVCA